MIIDFTIQNFRSIKDETLLSMHVESPRNHLSTHVAYPAGDRIGVLRSIGIYGANASGKTNILLAFQALQNLVVYSGDLKEGEPIPWYDPYRLSDATKKAPVKFELVVFSHDNIRYLYSVSFTHTSIIEESLVPFSPQDRRPIFLNEPRMTRGKQYNSEGITRVERAASQSSKTIVIFRRLLIVLLPQM